MMSSETGENRDGLGQIEAEQELVMTLWSLLRLFVLSCSDRRFCVCRDNARCENNV